MAVVNRLALLFGVTLATMGVGIWVEGVAAGLEPGTGATILATSGAEAVTFVALSQAFLDSDHSVGHIATELAFNFVMFGALRRFSKFVEAANMGKALKVGVTFTGQTVIATAAGLAKTEIDAALHDGKHLTEASVKQICLESVVQAVAMTLVSSGFSPIMEELQSAGKELGTSIKIANEKGRAVEQMVKALNGKVPIDDALAAIKAHREWGEAKLKAFEALESIIEQEKLNPPKKGESVFDKTKLTPEQIAKLKGSIAEATATMKAAEAMLTLEPSGPQTFDCPSERIGKVIDDLGGKPESVTEDPVSKLKTYRIKGPDGKLVTIRETKLGPNADGKGAPNNAPDLDLAHLPESSQSIARWQTDGISHDAPGTWDKKAADGRTFKEVYAEWMKQPERIRKNGDKWEPILPANCPSEFVPIFKRVVAEGNITLTTQGEANVAKLKAAGIDLDKLDPLSPEYFAQRDKIVGILGEEAVKRWEASKTATADGTKADVAKRVSSVVPPEAIASLRAAFPDCEIIMSGSISQTGKPLTGDGGIADVDIFLVVPEGTPIENRIAMEKRASGMKLPTTPAFQEAKGLAELPVDAKAMTPEEYLGMRTVDPGKRTPLGDVRVDSNAPSGEDVAKRYGVSTDPAQVKTFDGLFKKDPVGAAQWANGLKAAPGLAGRMLGLFGEGALRHFKSSGGDTVNIHGRLDITAQKLESLADADIKKLVAVCEKNGPEADFEYFEKSAGPNAPGYRLRFSARLASRASDAASQVLGTLGIAAEDPRATIFKAMSPDDQTRMWDLANEPSFKGGGELRKQAARWALGKNPSSARQFVADFQFYVAEVSNQTDAKVADFLAPRCRGQAAAGRRRLRRCERRD